VDLALLQIDTAANAGKPWLLEGSGLPFLDLSFDVIEDGTPVYSYGFPLSPEVPTVDIGIAAIAYPALSPRVTSTVIASNAEVVGGIPSTDRRSRNYVTDKAFKYGNSGCPLIVVETGAAVAAVVRFQPVEIDQGSGSIVWIPSLYGVASSLANVAEELRSMLPVLTTS
jgi:hypothetical protein